MENQELFDKIRHSLADDTQPAPNWDKASVWERVEARQRPRRQVFGWWWWAAAASVVMLLGGWWLLNNEGLPTKNTETITAKNTPKVQNFRNVPTIVKTETPSANIRKVQVAQQHSITKQTATAMTLENAPKVEVQVSENQTINLGLTSDSALSQVVVAEPQALTKEVLTKPKERVLIVDIDLPDAPQNKESEQLKSTFLERLGQEVKRSRTNRKFDIKALDRRPGKGGWTWVAHSMTVPEPK